MRASTRLTRCVVHAAALCVAGTLVSPVAAGDDSHLPPPIVRRVTRPRPAPRPVPQRPPTPAPTPPPTVPAPPPGPLPQPGTLLPPTVRQVRPGTPPPPPPPRGTTGSGEIAPAPLTGVDDIGIELPPEAPPKPREQPEPADGDVGFRVARPGGALRVFRDESDPKQRRLIIVMVGNPRIWRPAHTVVDNRGRERAVDSLTVKSNSMVVWVDGGAFPGLEAYVGASEARDDGRAQGLFERGASVVPRALLGIYAEGAVELSFGPQRITAQELYLDPHGFRALIIEPRFDGRARGSETLGGEPLSLHVRARRARLIRRGFTVFDKAEVSTSRSDDRIVLRVESLSVEEFAEPVGPDGAEASHFLGYQSGSTQRYTARTITIQGERLPLFWVPELAFGGSDEGEGFPTTIEGVRLVRQSHLGVGLFVAVGSDIGPQDHPWFHVTAELGGYTERGPAGGLSIDWSHLEADNPVRSEGYVESWFVNEQDIDRNGFVPPDFRYRVVSESRTYLGDTLIFDLGFGAFSDRGFNNEFFERDDLEHKDRESYGRLRWQPTSPGNIVATLTGKWHQRDFVTETGELPVAGLWVASAPILTPSRRGGLGVDVTSVSQAGRYERYFDEDLSMTDYGAWRLYTDTRLHAAADVGDARVTGYVGGVGANYTDVSTGPDDDLTRSALVTGVSADLQMHRTWGARGGWFQLNGLRHVVDAAVGYESRIGDRKALDEVPFFDRFDLERDHQALVVRLRNRLQTRAASKNGKPGRPRNIADLEIIGRRYFDDIAPYGISSPGSIEWILSGTLREGLTMQGDGLIDLEGGVQRSFFSTQLSTTFRDKPLTWNTGVRYVRGRIWAITNDIRWQMNERYQFEALTHLDFDEGQSVYRFLARRFSRDHAIAVGASFRDDSGVTFEFFFEPAIGGRSESSIQRQSDFFTFGADPLIDRSR